nr:hypothetical protein [uncultured Shinella sp.]
MSTIDVSAEDVPAEEDFAVIPDLRDIVFDWLEGQKAEVAKDRYADQTNPIMIAQGVLFRSARFVDSEATALRISDGIDVMEDSICLSRSAFPF